MGNAVKFRIQIDGNEIDRLIRKRSGYKEMAKSIGWSERAIRDGVKSNSMSVDLWMCLGSYLDLIDINADNVGSLIIIPKKKGRGRSYVRKARAKRNDEDLRECTSSV